MLFKEKLKKHIAPMVLAMSISGSALLMNPVIVHALDSQEESVVEVSDEKVITSKFLNSRGDADNWIKSRIDILSQAYNITKVKIYLYKGMSTNMESYPICEEYYNKRVAEKRLEELQENEYFASSVELKEIKRDTKVIYQLVGKMFRTIHHDRYKVEISYINKEKNEIISEHKRLEATEARYEPETLENLKEEGNDLSENPKLGDDSNVEMYAMTLMASTTGLAYMSSRVKKKSIHK